MIKAVTIIGARPQIIKAAAISRSIRNSYNNELQEIIVHTGQHYDENMSEVFFGEMEIPLPDYNLNVGSSSQAMQTSLMMQKIEQVLIKEKPDVVILYGDANSTLAGSVTAAKIHIPIIHIEAGLRSFNKSMPEEINRIICDHNSTLLFVPTIAGISNLEKEGIKIYNKPPFNIDNPGVFHCGDVMFDNAVYYAEKAKMKKNIIEKMNLEEEKFLLSTIHRNNNTDDTLRLNSIFSAIHKISSENKLKVIIPLHPRTSKILKSNLSNTVYDAVINNSLINIIPPVSFFDMINLEKNSKMIFTDSGGVQKEAYFYEKPCIIMRSETEWVEIVESGAAMVCDADEEKIIQAFEHLKNIKLRSLPQIFGDGKSADFICKTLIKNFR